MFYRKPLEERIAERQAKMRPLKEGKHFEHGPAKFIFITLIVVVVVMHTVGLAIAMHFA
ncbi:hypothetical protein [Nonomuraea rhodomycinica]|uniref:Uncharacterized protein n=1 Tax=Nonomuraea rhodomycinica TaxID=1712872 RepID=A0A7Y6IQM1_9ACTN|nr:hypothetical protein [Nonomuraea rhodomycinica]NUW42291.1 hypothetical protein [Nonomuraea rhodomycinica]